jgi:hypothetical protein
MNKPLRTTVHLIICLLTPLAVTHTGCAKPGSSGSNPPTVEPYAGQPFEALVGKRIRVAGEAVNLKAGGAVMVGKMPVYVGGVDEWSAPIIDRKVQAIGVVRRIPDPPPGAAGVVGGFVLDDARWQVVEE